MIKWLRQYSLYSGIAWAFFIAVLSLTPGNRLPDLHWELLSPEVLAHFLFYAVLIIFIGIHLVKINKLNTINAILLVGLGTLYGLLIELIQGCFIPGRSFEYGDIAVNAVGAVTGLTIILVVLRVRRSR